MEFWLINIIAVLVLCVFFAGIIIPQILLIAFRKKLFDMPNERKIHSVAVPRLGGLAFMPVVLFSMLLTFGFDIQNDATYIFNLILPRANMMIFISCAVMMLYVVGMADDLIGIKYRAKFIVQVLSACLMICGGVWIDNWHGILGLHDISPWFGWPFTVLVAVFITNAINLIDGVDGLASGLCSIAFLTYCVAFYFLGDYICAMLSAGCLGVLIPFYYYNVFGDASRRKKIFMGDTGSLTIGMMATFLSVHLCQTKTTDTIYDVNLAVVAFVPLLIPCFDVIRVYGERLLNRKNPFMPDKRHIHHKLMDCGLSPRRTMVTIVLMSLGITAVNVLLSVWVNVTILLFADMLAWAGLVIFINKLRARTLK